MTRRTLSLLFLFTVLMQQIYGASFTVNKSFKAGVLTPLCLPFDVTSQSFDELYAVGGIENGVATLFSVSEVATGHPCVYMHSVHGISQEDITYFKTTMLE